MYAPKATAQQSLLASPGDAWRERTGFDTLRSQTRTHPEGGREGGREDG